MPTHTNIVPSLASAPSRRTFNPFNSNVHFPGSSGFSASGVQNTNPAVFNPETRVLTPANFGQTSVATIPTTIGAQNGVGSGGATPTTLPNAPGGVASGDATNPFSTLTNVKNPDIKTQIDKLLGDFDTSRTRTQGLLDKFIEKTGQVDQRVGAFNEQESAAVGNFFDGTTASELGGIREGRAAALDDAVRLALDEAQRTNSLSALQNGGGLSSYLNRQALGNANRVLVPAALDASEQERRDLEFLTTNQNALLGRRAGLFDADLQRGLLPIQATSALDSADIDNLNRLIQGDQANTFFGLTKPFEADASGLTPISSSQGSFDQALNLLRNSPQVNTGGLTLPAQGGAAPQATPRQLQVDRGRRESEFQRFLGQLPEEDRFAAAERYNRSLGF